MHQKHRHGSLGRLPNTDHLPDLLEYGFYLPFPFVDRLLLCTHNLMAKYVKQHPVHEGKLMSHSYLISSNHFLLDSPKGAECTILT